MSHFKKSVLPFFLVVLLALSFANLVSASFHPTPSPVPLADEDKILENKALQFLDNVANVNTSSYQIEHLWIRDEAAVPLPYSGKTFHFNLTSTAGILDVIAEFTNGELFWSSIYSVRGSPIPNHPTSSDVLITAKDTLAQLQGFSAKDYLPTFQSMLNSVAELKNSEISNANWTQKININGNLVTITWEPNANNLSNPQNNLYLEFQNGNLQIYSNYLGLYEIGSSDVKISEAQAIQIAVDHARNFSYVQNGVTVSNFTILEDLAIANISLGNRGNNTLYPYWSIIVPLAKEYPGGVTYFRVVMWADTGEITYFSPMGSYGDSNPAPSSGTQQTASPTIQPSSQNNPITLDNRFKIGTGIVVAGIIIIGYLFYKKKR
jgi:hypothetical protein